MPTRYSLDIFSDLATAVTEDALGDNATEAKKTTRKALKDLLEKRFKDLGDPKSAGNEKAGFGALYFYKKLKF